MSDIFAGGDGDSSTSDETAGAGGDLPRPDAATGEPAEDFHDAKKLTIPVNPARLAWGRYDHGRSRDVGEGDIHVSYSADRIAGGESVRKPFPHDGAFWICTSITGSGLTSSGSTEHEAYRIMPERMFNETPTTYGTRTSTSEMADAARNDPNGFYHGVTVKHGRETFVLCGPPLRFVPAENPARPGTEPDSPEPLQLSLF